MFQFKSIYHLQDVFDALINELEKTKEENNNSEEIKIIEELELEFWKLDGTVNTNHDWYYQIQGQLHIR